MSTGNLKELYDACNGEFDIPLADRTFTKEFVINEALHAAHEIDNMLYVYITDDKYRLITYCPETWKTNGLARVYPGGRIEYRKLIEEV